MIPKSVTMKSFVGKHAVTTRDLQNRYGVIAQGTEVLVFDSNSYGMDIRTPKCECCGVSIRMTHVKRGDLTLCAEESPC